MQLLSTTEHTLSYQIFSSRQFRGFCPRKRRGYIFTNNIARQSSKKLRYGMFKFYIPPPVHLPVCLQFFRHLRSWTIAIKSFKWCSPALLEEPTQPESQFVKSDVVLLFRMAEVRRWTSSPVPTNWVSPIRKFTLHRKSRWIIRALQAHCLWSRCDLLRRTRAFLPSGGTCNQRTHLPSTHRVLVLSVQVIREGAQDFIAAKQFYANCLGIKMELDRKWRRIVDASLVRAHKPLGYLSWGSCLPECKRDLSSCRCWNAKERRPTTWVWMLCLFAGM